MVDTWSVKVWALLSNGGHPNLATKKYIVDLTADEREHLFQLVRHGKHSSRKVMRARILIKADEGLRDKQIAEVLNTSVPTVERTRRRFVEESLGALDERPRPGQRRKLNTKGEAHLIAIACSTPPAGRDHWTLRLLADKIVELGFAASFSHETVRRVLKKTRSSPGKSSSGASRR
jgi:transposase